MKISTHHPVSWLSLVVIISQSEIIMAHEFLNSLIIALIRLTNFNEPQLSCRTILTMTSFIYKPEPGL